ncbi:MAG TPA: TetR family transcriptional regulator, partial [Acinetobacter nosocomialis]|nr:TetR family transcriptional regulator [Acinetobacter nosocomialis]
MKPNPIKKSEAKRLHILNTSSDLILHKGFTGVGLQEILQSCEIPKGS